MFGNAGACHELQGGLTAYITHKDSYWTTYFYETFSTLEPHLGRCEPPSRQLATLLCEWGINEKNESAWVAHRGFGWRHLWPRRSDAKRSLARWINWDPLKPIVFDVNGLEFAWIPPEVRVFNACEQ